MSLLTGYIIAIATIIIGILFLRYLITKKNMASLQDLVEEKTKNIRRLHLEIFIAEEKHREFIATEFHDRVAQYLAMARNKISLLKQEFGEAHQDIHDVYDLIDTSIRETRSLIEELNPPILHQSEFGAAIVWLVHQMCESNSIHTEINNLVGKSHSARMDRETKTILFQSTREILNNIVKHAQADTVSVEVWTEREYIWIKITDDGIGISSDVQQTNVDEGGYGLTNVRVRLQRLNGQFDLYSDPGYGTTIKLGAPIQINNSNMN